MKILFIAGLNETERRLNDYMHDIVLHGLRELYGNSVIDYPGVWYMYDDEVKKRNYDINNLWGKGFTLYNLLSNYQQIDRIDIKKTIVEDKSKIENNISDYIINVENNERMVKIIKTNEKVNKEIDIIVNGEENIIEEDIEEKEYYDEQFSIG